MSSVTVIFGGGKKFIKSCYHHVTRHKILTCLLWRTFCCAVYYFNSIINLGYTGLHYNGLIWNRSYYIPDCFSMLYHKNYLSYTILLCVLYWVKVGFSDIC